MKAPGIIQGIVVAIIACIAAAILSGLLSVIVTPGTGTRLVIAILTLSYLLFLLKHGQDHTGRITVVTSWILITFCSWLIDISLLSFLLSQTAIIWIVRSLYFHNSILSALLDGALVTTGLVASAWAIFQTGSFMTGVWSFFLVQSFFGLIPQFGKSETDRKTRSFTSSAGENDRFNTAHRVAQDAVRKLSTF